jgi:hypothetical protein
VSTAVLDMTASSLPNTRRFRRHALADNSVMPSGPVQVVFAMLFSALAAFGEWVARRAPRSLPWKRGGAAGALRMERAMVRVLEIASVLVGLSFLIVAISDL